MIQKADRLKNVKEYYFSKKLREVAALRNEGKPIINIAIGSPDLQPSASVIEAIQNAVELPNAHQYQSYQGIPELREGIANFYKEKYYVDLNANSEILPLMGSKEGIMHISLAFLNEEDVSHLFSQDQIEEIMRELSEDEYLTTNYDDAMKKLKHWFTKFEILGWWDKKVEELSKGMQQKIQFVTTVIHEPELLIFDEPFSGFDPINTNLLKQETAAV